MPYFNLLLRIGDAFCQLRLGRENLLEFVWRDGVIAPYRFVWRDGVIAPYLKLLSSLGS